MTYSFFSSKDLVEFHTGIIGYLDKFCATYPARAIILLVITLPIALQGINIKNYSSIVLIMFVYLGKSGKVLDEIESSFQDKTLFDQAKYIYDSFMIIELTTLILAVLTAMFIRKFMTEFLVLIEISGFFYFIDLFSLEFSENSYVVPFLHIVAGFIAYYMKKDMVKSKKIFFALLFSYAGGMISWVLISKIANDAELYAVEALQINCDRLRYYRYTMDHYIGFLITVVMVSACAAIQLYGPNVFEKIKNIFPKNEEHIPVVETSAPTPTPATVEPVV